MHPRARQRLISELAEGSARAARTLNCPRCGDPIIRGDDDDKHAVTVNVDAAILDPADEMLAALDGTPTFTLQPMHGKTSPNGAHALHYRDHWQKHSARPPRGTVHKLHACTGTRKDTLF